MKARSVSMVDFYRTQAFNPVLIRIEDEQIWKDHLSKRMNLYERHLGIPLTLLEGRRVLEFGCNSGENGLVLAASGARLTFVEPNREVLPRLRELFQRMRLDSQIEAIHEAEIQSFDTEELFDLVIAEGFLSTLADRDQMLSKLLRFVKPMGFCIISYNDRCGGLLEMLKRAILFRAYALLHVKDVQSDRALDIASAFFQEDFQKLNASRSFETWWRDTMVAPVYTAQDLWSCRDILPVIESSGCLLQATSPVWSTWEHFNWYKNTTVLSEVNTRFLDEWKRHLAYFVTGFRPYTECQSIALESAIADAEYLVQALSRVAEGELDPVALRGRTSDLLAYFRTHPDDRFGVLADQLSLLMEALSAESYEGLLTIYQESSLLRSAWGTPYHYFCIKKLFTSSSE